MTHEHKPIIEGGPSECPYCPPIPTQAAMDKVIAVGFGGAVATRDGECVADGENGLLFVHGDSTECREPLRTDDWLTFGDIEKLAVADPDHDWRIVLHGPLHGETYQRQGVAAWVCIERNEGFA